MPIELPIHNSEACLPECERAAVRIVLAASRTDCGPPVVIADWLKKALMVAFAESRITAAQLEAIEAVAVRDLNASWANR